MKKSSLLRVGIDAAEELASELLGFSIRKAIDPLTAEGFLLISEEIAEQLATSAEGAELEVVAAALKSLDVKWAALSDVALTAAIRAVEEAIVKHYLDTVVPTVGGILSTQGPAFMRLVRVAMKATQGIDIITSLSERDLKSEEAIRTSQLNFIRDSAGVRAHALSQKARDLVSNAVAQGHASDAIAKRLQEHFKAEIPRPESYWRVVSDSFVGRARARSQIDSLFDADIETFELVATLDEVTTDICRFMHGKTFSVAGARKVLDNVEKLDNPETIKYAQPWVRKGRDPDGGMRLYVNNEDGSATTIAKIDRSGVGKLDDVGEYSGGMSVDALMKLGIPCPPFHGRCRTVIVAAEEKL